MRRFLAAAVIALLLLAVATPANAGYLIIRVILEGSGSGAAGGGFEPGVGPGPGTGSPDGGSPSGGGYGAFGGGRKPGPGGGDAFTPGQTPGGMGGVAGPVQHDPTRSLVVVVPVEEDLGRGTAFYQTRAFNQFSNPVWRPKLRLNYRGQRFVTNVFTDNVSVQLYDALLQTPSARFTRASEIEALHLKWVKSKTDPKLLYNALAAALEFGMVDEAVKYADELLTFAEGKTGLAPEVEAFARAYKAVQKGIKSPPPQPSPAAQWQSRLKAQGVMTQAHYSVVYWDATESEVKRRAAMLEENFKGFFLWHATRGIALPVPEAPLVAVLPKSGAEVIRLARGLDAPARMPADGFYAVEHDVLVLSPERLDDLGRTFSRQAQQFYQQGTNRDALLRGDGPKLSMVGEPGTKRPEEAARMQTVALVDRLVEDAATVSAVSREGSKQLLYRTGQLPRYVELPEWLAHGSANFFTRPKDPAYIAGEENKWTLAVAATTGYGGPNYQLQRYFRDFLEKKDLHPDRAMLLKNVLTDAYFRGLRDPKDAVDPDPIKPEAKGISVAGGGGAGAGIGAGAGAASGGYGAFGGGRLPGGSGSGGPPGPAIGGGGVGSPDMLMGDPNAQAEEDASLILRKKRDRLALKAHATAWALYYYLAKDRPNELRRFAEELAGLPRDLPLDGDTVVAVFCRSFAVDNNKESLARFADGWLDYIKVVPSASVDVPLLEPKPSGGGMQMGPGGIPYGPGGGPGSPGQP